MSSGVVWLAAWLALPVLGAPLLTHPAYRGFSRPARVVLSGAAGAVALSFAMTVSTLAGARWSTGPLAAAAVGICLLLRALLRGSVPTAPAAAPRAAGARLIAVAALAVALLATLSGAAGSSDLIFFWGPKAQAFAQARSIDAEFLKSPAAALMHPYYPPLVPNLDALATIVAGRFSWSAAALTLPLLLAALALALPSLLRQADRPFSPDAVSALAVCALALVGIEADVAGNGDVFLWFFEILGLALLLGPAPVDTARLVLAGVLLAGAATAKVEGLPFVAAAAFFVAAGGRRGLAVRPLVLLAAPTALALGSWHLFGLWRQAFRGYGEYGSLLEVRWDRLPDVLTDIGKSLWSAGSALPWLIPFAVLVASRAKRRGLPLAVATTLAVFLVVTYLLPVPDSHAWIRWSAARTFFPIAPLLALAAAGPRFLERVRSTAAEGEGLELSGPATKGAGR